MPSAQLRQPTLYIPHGGGPWPFMDDTAMGLGNHEFVALRDFLIGLPMQLPAPPKAVLVVSAHWEAPVPTLMTCASPPLYFDYTGFPPHTYQLQWPAPGSPSLAARVSELLAAAGIVSTADTTRGFDHGTFVPLLLSFPEAQVPTIQLSLQAGLDPTQHLKLGAALMPLRDEGILIVGSGMSFHNMRLFGNPRSRDISTQFDAWLQSAVTAPPIDRTALLANWEAAPNAREAHPREEHLLPLMVCAGAAGTEIGSICYSGTLWGAQLSAVKFG